MDLDITSLAEDPTRWDAWDQLDGLWPAFMTQDPTGGLYYGHLEDDFADHCLLAPDGLPEDPWLRVHVRAGGRIVTVAHCSMVMTGRLAQWRAWTGLPFDTDGPVEVPKALAPVHCSLAQDVAVYVEPNVWVHHRL